MTAARTGRTEHLGVVEQVEDPQDQGLLVGDGQAHHHRPVVTVLDDAPGPSSATIRPDFGPVDQHVDLHLLAVAELPRIAGEGSSTSKSSGSRAEDGSPTSGEPSIRSTRNVRASPRSRSNPITYQWPSRNRSPATSTWRWSPR